MTEIAAIVGWIALVGLVVALLLSPLESLGWWAGWFGRRDELERDVDAARGHPGVDTAVDRSLTGPPIVFLSGIGAISGENHLPGEVGLLADLRRELPDALVVGDVFPYAAGGNALTSERLFSRLWRLLLKVQMSQGRMGQGGIAAKLVNLRNLLQVLVSADRRYGPVFNYGVSRQIVRSVVRAGYGPGSGVPVFLLGSSGGGQVALGVAPFVTAALGAPVEVISLGGVMSSDPGLDDVTRLTHVHGDRDGVHGIGARVFPQRWRIVPTSSWNRARREGRIVEVVILGVKHQGRGGYVDGETVLDDGTTPRQRTVDTVCRVVTARLDEHAPQPQ